MSDAAYLAFDHSSETTLTDVVNSVFTRRRIVIANDSLAMVFLVQMPSFFIISACILTIYFSKIKKQDS